MSPLEQIARRIEDVRLNCLEVDAAEGVPDSWKRLRLGLVLCDLDGIEAEIASQVQALRERVRVSA